MNNEYVDKILNASVYEVAVETPLERAPRLSERLDNEVYFKREDLQPVFSFKLRGAYNKLARLPPGVLAKGVICSSAGNHAQGVALAAKHLGTTATVVMPVTTPRIKIEAVLALGGDVIIEGENYDEAYSYAVAHAEADDLSFVHPFDDPDVIAGQGTIAIELLKQQPEQLDAVFVPVGGGGLIAGIAAYLKSASPDVRVIGVEAEEPASMSAALEAGGPVNLDQVGIFADGVAVKRVGDETFRLVSAFVDQIVLVNTDEICAAIKDIFEDTRGIAEPAGAMAVAGLKKYVVEHDLRGARLVTINGGANVNFDRLRHIAERADIGEQREALLAVRIDEHPGSFRAFCEAIGKRNVTEFNYRYADSDQARIFVGIGLDRGAEEKRLVIAELRKLNYPVVDMSDNELAKLHVRHMVGGVAPRLEDELVFRFQFPERRGALMDFLGAVGDQWNISLFHYRNHGSDYGRVLAGVQVPEQERQEFGEHLRALGYPYWDESDNPTYRLFLAEGGESE